MPAPSQIRAARGLLGLTQQEVAAGTGLGPMTVSDIEKDRAKPKAGTLDTIRRFYEGRGIEFTLDGGVRPSSNTVQIFDGPDCYIDFINEAHALLAPRGGEILFSGADERRSPDRIIEKFRAMRADGVTMRSLIRPGDDFIMGNPQEYRWMPADLFVEGDVKAIVDDRVAWLVSWLDNPRVIMIKDPVIAQEQKRLFDYLWRSAQGPESSSAGVNY